MAGDRFLDVSARTGRVSTHPGDPDPGMRLLVLGASMQESRSLAERLARASLSARACRDVDGLIGALHAGAAAVVLSTGAFAAALDRLIEALDEQPPWSDLPIILIGGARAPAPDPRLVERLGNVILLDRPLKASSLQSAARSAIRARARQYETRAHLENLRRADRRKDEFLATLAHELRNPLAPIRNSIEVLRLALPSPQAVAPLQMISRQLANLVRLVDDLFEIARITQGKIVLRPVPIELATIVDAAVESSLPNIDEHGHRLHVEVPPGVRLQADPARLAQVFANLLNNAAKYTEAGGDITIAAAIEDGIVRISVRDSGIGMPASFIPHVFDLFIQANHATSRTSGGLGIGLTLVRTLVELHGGTVTAASEGRGLGSTFTVALPCSAPAGGTAGPAALTASATRAAPGSDGAKELPLVTSPRRVLVVDDNQDAADSLAELLTLLGAQVSVRYAASEALDDLERIQPEVAFLDLGMPGMDGYALAREIRRREPTPRPVLVALTGWGQQQDREATAEAGYDHHLVKPASLEMLRAILAGR